MPIIVLEGPDGAGKSSVADAIRAMRPHRSCSLRCGPPKRDENLMAAYMDVALHAGTRSGMGDVVVVDRLHLGELAYGPVLRGRSKITMAQATAIDMELDSYGALRVVLMPLARELRRRMLARDGGAPDAKSGSRLEHAGPIRAAYAWALSGLDGWLVLDGSGYPDAIAMDLLSRVE